MGNRFRDDGLGCGGERCRPQQWCLRSNAVLSSRGVAGCHVEMVPILVVDAHECLHELRNCRCPPGVRGSATVCGDSVQAMQPHPLQNGGTPAVIAAATT